MKEEDRQLLTRVEDRISFLYIEKARIEQTEYSVQIVQGRTTVEIPITTVNLLIFGPGVSVTHRAVENIASAGCGIMWTGENGTPFYTHGEPTTKHSKNLLIQIQCHEDTKKRLSVIRKMYEIRYPTEHLKSATLEKLRGLEGMKVKELYRSLSEETGVIWEGRSAQVDDTQDEINRILTFLNQVLYGIIQAALEAMGFSSAIGFIHTGNMRSFVFDISDIYKEHIVIPLAFSLAHKHITGRHEMLKAFRERIYSDKLLKRLGKDLKTVFSEFDTNIPEIDGVLWNGENFVRSGINHSQP